MLRSLAASLVLAAMFIAGCSSNSPVHGIFGPQGGTLSDEGATLTIPPGALASETTITMTPSPGTAAPDGALQVGTPQLLQPEGLMFAVPVTLEMAIDSSKLAGKPAGAIAVYTTPASLVAYTTLPTSVVDATHVSALTTHFSIFQPAIQISPSVTTGGSSSTGGTGTSGGTTTRGTTSGGSSGKPATATGGSAGNGTSGSTSGGTTTGGSTTGAEVPDGGEVDAGPDGGEEADAGPDGGQTDAGPGDAGINSGGTAICSTNSDCVGALGCMAIAIDSKSNGAASCNNPFLVPSEVPGGIGNGGFFHPGTTPPVPAINASLDSWSVEIDLPCCPASTGTMAVSAVVNWSAGGANCDGAPKGTGTVDITTIDDGGLAGTFTTSVLAGMSGSFSLPSTLDAAFCDAGQPDLPPPPVDIEDAGADAGTADCSADLDCLGPDGGTVTGTGSFWLNPAGAADGTWCKGPLDDLSSSASMSGSAPPTLAVTYNSDFFGLQAALPCCPAGPGTLSASITLASNVCGSVPNAFSPMVSGGTGSVTFTQTDGGLVGSIHLDGTTEADATFSIP